MIPEDTRVQGFRGSSEKIEKYQYLKAWQVSYELCLDLENNSKISGDTLKKTEQKS